ncbi:MAG: tRNA dihydrouridine synthase DusB [Pseudomonadota bacterium]|nr:tRNA dihydrouridine synthase DusB [Pseudomonadota bacterium]
MKIGNIVLENNLILAPMAGVTDRPFRQLCRRSGAGLAVSEMVTADTALWGTRKSARRLDHRGEAGPISAQIVGADPDAMAEAARINLGLGAEIIDINMGCPAKKVCKTAAGSALLRDERLVARILEAVVGAVPGPVTLKIRTGWSPEERNALRIAHIARESGIAALAVHGRTRACGFSGRAEYESIRAIKKEVRIPVVANGDIDSPEKARFVLDYTGADAIMVGRAAQGRPWIFREIYHYLESGVRPRSPSLDWIKDTLIAHLQELYGFYGGNRGVRIARKHVAWYCRNQVGARQFREQFNRAETPNQQQDLIESFFGKLSPREDQAA